ncbi:MAG: hypothetical protein IJM81_01935 [Prevotella sp.]|nr:hypothetical protein [Prevotella sp.]
MEDFLLTGFLSSLSPHPSSFEGALPVKPLRYDGRSAANSFPSPDIYHLLGRPDEKITTILRHAYKLRVPVVYSPLDTTAMTFSGMERYVSAIHLNSRIEQRELAKTAYKGKGVLIPNALTTTLITPQAMAGQLHQLYSEVLKLSEEKIRKEIASKVPQAEEPLQVICQQVLYARLLIARRRLTRRFLSDLASYLVQTPYDEDKLQELLLALKVYPLMGRLLQLMSETARLTEGFMPIPPLDDKAANHIRQHLEE